jgi:Glycosyltransferases involved in cell wall biogenesis
MKTLSIIVPCYNEEPVIEAAYSRIRSVLNKMPLQSDIIFINDGSKDNTGNLLNYLAQKDPLVKVIHFSRNFGHQSAVTAGINKCTSDMAVIIDADLQDPPEVIPDLIKKMEDEQANVVYCVRKKRLGESKFKLWSAKAFYRFMNRLSEVEFPVDTGDFRLIDSKIIKEFNALKEREKYIRGLITWVGFKQVPYYYEREARYAGETKYPLSRMIRLATKALFYFSKKPLLLATGLGFFAVLVGVVLVVWYFMGKIIGYTNAESGFTSIMIIVIFFGGIQLLTIGVLGQYIGILFDEVKERPQYIVESSVNFETGEE